MIRLFNTSEKRSIKELNNTWRLMPDFDNSGVEKGYSHGLPSESRNAYVLYCWNFELDL